MENKEYQPPDSFICDGCGEPILLGESTWSYSFGTLTRGRKSGQPVHNPHEEIEIITHLDSFCIGACLDKDLEYRGLFIEGAIEPYEQCAGCGALLNPLPPAYCAKCDEDLREREDHVERKFGVNGSNLSRGY